MKISSVLAGAALIWGGLGIISPSQASVMADHVEHSHQGEPICSMFPKNNLRFPVNTGNHFIGQPTFNRILAKVEAVYRPYFQRFGHRFVIERRWLDPEVNAYATNEGFQRTIHMYGGLARHPLMTPDGFIMVACHEIGHHLGGAPLKARVWASSEGESDYFATLKCMRKVLEDEDNDFAVSHMALDPDAVRLCNVAHHTRADINICLRSVMAGKALASVLADAGGSKKLPGIRTPDPMKTVGTYVEHPAAQCRLDTYLHGALCGVSADVPLSPKSIRAGSCDDDMPRPFGQRPHCWFDPNDPRVLPQ